MSLGSLPALPAKARLSTTVALDEPENGDFIFLSTVSDGTLAQTHDYLKNEHNPLENFVPEQSKSSSKTVETPSSRPENKHTDNGNGGFWPVTQTVNHEFRNQQLQVCCKANASEAKNSHDYLDEVMVTSPITRAIIRGDHTLVLESLRQGENAGTFCSKSGQGYLHIISRQARSDNETAWVPMVYQLSNSGADLNHRDKTGCTAARVAIRRKLVQILAALLKCGAELGAAELEEAESVRGVIRTAMLEVVRRFSPGYWEAVLDPNSFKVSRLVKAWARVNISRPGEGQTLVEFAKKNARDSAVVNLLLQHEASIELAHAVMAGDTQRAKVLLCNGGADLSTADFSVRSPALHAFAPLSLRGAAEKYGHMKVLKLLQHRQTDISKSTSASLSQEVVCDWSSRDGLPAESAGAIYQGRTGNRPMASPPSSAMCSIL